MSVLESFNPYEQEVLMEIAKHRLSPSILQNIFGIIGMPAEMIWQKVSNLNKELAKKVQDKVNESIRAALIETVQFGSNLITEDRILEEFHKRKVEVPDYRMVKTLPMKHLDCVADAAAFANGVMATTEGTVTGIMGTIGDFPGAQLIILGAIGLDVTLVTTILARQSCQVGASYGYAPRETKNIPHFLAAMSPNEPNEILGIKRAALQAVDELGKALGGKEAAAIIDRVVTMLAERFGIVIGDKALAMLVPGIGVAVNAKVSQQLQADGFVVAKDYFRELTLVERYGEDIVNNALEVCCDFYKPNSAK